MKGGNSACLPNRSPAGHWYRRQEEKMVAQVTAAIDEAYHIGDTLVFLQECAPENVAMNGRLSSEDPRIREILQKISS